MLGEKGGFMTLLNVNMYIKLISFFPFVKISYMFSALPVTLPAWNLLDFQYYDGDTGGTTHFHFSPNILSLSCQFYILKILVTIVCFIKAKSVLHKYIDLTVRAYEENSMHRLSSGERMDLWSSFLISVVQNGREGVRMVPDCSRCEGSRGRWNFWLSL